MSREVVVFKSSSGFRVRPAYVSARPGERVYFRNVTGKPVHFFFPEATVFKPRELSVAPEGSLPESVFKKRREAEAAGRDTDASVAVLETAPYGLHAYAAYSEEAGDFAEGESSPGVIIGG